MISGSNQVNKTVYQNLYPFHKQGIEYRRLGSGEPFSILYLGQHYPWSYRSGNVIIINLKLC